ncbi:MAG: hypothetical protein HWD60_19825 [Defluviicoccus sp.]|nr:MAG: hypothetical protein HWD60_19825 [Defluviicoccus sp.]
MPRSPAVLIATALSMGALSIGTLCVGACSSDPIIDTKGVDNAKYQQDLAECKQYADQVDVASNAGSVSV